MQLSVLIPSNRKLDACRKSIESAIAYCQKRGAQLIVSDNSGDFEKEVILRRHGDKLLYTQPNGTSGKDNLLHLLDIAETEFILIMGDDDEIYVSPDETLFDLETLPADYIGVRPLTAVAGSDGRIRRVKTFDIADHTPSERVLNYNSNAGGDNTSYYSIFRRKPFVALQKFFYSAHPLQADFCDWVLAHTLFASGKMAYDPGTIYKYNMHQWETNEQIVSNIHAMRTAVGLPEDMGGYMLLLTYLDLVIMGCRADSPLDEEGKLNLITHAGQALFHTFSRHVLNTAHDFDIDALEMAVQGLQETDWRKQFQLGLNMLEFLKPGLKSRYQAFNAAAEGLTLQAA